MPRPPRLLALLTILLACGVLAPASSSSVFANSAAQRWIVSLDTTAKQASVLESLTQAGYTPQRTLDCASAVVVSESPGMQHKSIDSVQKLAGVENVEPDDMFVMPRRPDMVKPLSRLSEPTHAKPTPRDAARPKVIPDDEFFTYQWSLPRIDAPGAWDYTTGAADALSTVAILDSGVDRDHPDLAGRVFSEAGYNFVDNNTDTTDNSRVGSGTQIAGIIAATGNNSSGIAGLTWNSQIIPIKVLRPDPHYGGDVGQWSDVIAGICYAVSHNAQVIHIGVAASKLEQGPTLRRALDAAVASGAVIVAPGGDEGQKGNPTEYPAAFSSVISVSAVNESNDTVAESNSGSYITLSAPGDNVLTTVPMSIRPEGYGYLGGSNIAAAHVSGVALLIKAVNPTLTASEVRDILRQSADDLRPPGPDFTFGAGLVNARRAVLSTPHWLTVSPSEPLTFQWDQQNQEYQQQSLSIANTNTSALTWKAEASVPWLQVAAPQGATPSLVTVSPLPPTGDQCGTLITTVKAESTMPRQADGSKDVPVRVYLPECPRLPYNVYLPLILGGQ